jgi:peroxiredoxin
MLSRRSWISIGFFLTLTGLVVLMAWLNQDQLYSVEVGGPAPEFSAFDLQGTPVSLGDYRGSVLLLNIWATWCTPCKAEMPSIQRLYQDIDDDDFQVLAVSIDRAPSDDDRSNPLGGKLRAFADSLGLTFPILHDPSGEIATNFRTTGVPESFVLDRHGVILRKITGPTEWDAPQNVEFIQRLLEGATDPSQ